MKFSTLIDPDEWKSDEDWEKAYHWCKRKFGKSSVKIDIRFKNDVLYDKFSFENENDLMLFRLTWL